VTPVRAQDLVPAATEIDDGEGTSPSQPPSVVREKWCDPRDWGCYTRPQVELIAEIGRSEKRCRKSLSECRDKHQVQAGSWSVGTVILIASVAVVGGILLGGGVVLLIK